MNYNQSIKYLDSLQKFGIRLGLERITRLLDQLGNPQTSFQSIHIAGTNGKGSVAAMLASVLTAAGYKTGLYTSPHILGWQERIKVNGQEISKKSFAASILKVKKVADQMKDQPTIFEIVTAAALYYFAEQKVQIAVLEVGLGGRFDATNVVDPLISVITQISHDHTEVLGKSLSKIAFEKAGIIKKGRDVIVGKLPKEALKVIKQVTKEKQACLFHASGIKIKALKQTLKGQELLFRKIKLFLPLLGRHQIDNLAVVLRIMETATFSCRFPVSNRALKQGIKQVKWPLRFQLVSQKPLIIADAAHNLSGIKALTQTLESLNLKPPIVFYVGMLKRKDYPAMLKQLSKVSKEFLVGDFKHPEAALRQEMLQLVKGEYFPVSKARAVFRTRFKDHLICVTGSIYFVSEFLKRT